MTAPNLRRTLVLSIASLAAASLAAVGAAARAAPPPGGAAAGSFASVAAIFDRACVHCHGGDRPVQGLALDSHAGVLAGSKRTKVVVPGRPDLSALVGRLRGTIEPQMPFDGDALPAAEIQLVEDWIRAGAPGPESAPVPAAPVAPPAPPAPPAPSAPSAPPAPAAPAAPAAPVRPAGPVRWGDVQPILRANCVRCHQPKGLQGPAPEGLRFDSYDVTVGGGERASVVPGHPETSPLLRAIQGAARKRMPLDGPPWLQPEAVAVIERWIREGARGDDGKPAPIPTGREVRLFGKFDGKASIDGVAVGVDASTRVDGQPAAGATVEVRATVLTDGSLRATRLRARSASDGANDDSRPEANPKHPERPEHPEHPEGDDHGRHGRGGR